MAYRRGKWNVEMSIEHKHSVLDHLCWREPLELFIWIKRAGPNSKPDSVPALISTGPSIDSGTSNCSFSHSVTTVGNGLHDIPLYLKSATPSPK
jgi:hypothetical protein